MSSADDFARILTDARNELAEHAKARMKSKVLIERPGPEVTDRVTGKVTRSYTKVYEGRAKLRGLNADEVTIIGANAAAGSTGMHLPVDDPDAAEVDKGDRVTVTSSPDPRYTRTEAWVDGPFMLDEATARRFSVRFDTKRR